MKKVFALILCVSLLLCGCSAAPQSIKDDNPVVPETVKSVWMAYFELEKYTSECADSNSFESEIKSAFKKVKSLGLNTITVQVRPCADAFYKSSYFPVSKYCFGVQGSELIYDPLAIMVKAAHNLGLRIEAWVNPYRVSHIDFENKTISVNKIVVKKNQKGYSKGKHLSGKAKTVWYFGACKTKGSYRTVTVGDTLINALKEYKIEQDRHKLEYGYTYMKHYKKIVNNPYNNQPETKILNALAEIDVALPEVNFVFLKDNGIFEGTDTCKYPFKVIHYELGIPCRFHDFRDTHATRLIEARC